MILFDVDSRFRGNDGGIMGMRWNNGNDGVKDSFFTVQDTIGER